MKTGDFLCKFSGTMAAFRMKREYSCSSSHRGRERDRGELKRHFKVNAAWTASDQVTEKFHTDVKNKLTTFRTFLNHNWHKKNTFACFTPRIFKSVTSLTPVLLISERAKTLCNPASVSIQGQRRLSPLTNTVIFQTPVDKAAAVNLRSNNTLKSWVPK